MKKLVCDFCDSLRLGAKVGYREFQKTFREMRAVGVYAKRGNFHQTTTTPEQQKIAKIRR